MFYLGKNSKRMPRHQNFPNTETIVTDGEFLINNCLVLVNQVSQEWEFSLQDNYDLYTKIGLHNLCTINVMYR